MAEEKRQFPSEVIDLPSKGWFYQSDNPLSSGQVEIKYMTAKEEDILTSSNLIQKGIVMDKLLEALIVTEGVKLDDVLLGDKNAIMVASRVLAYGKDYPIEFTDGSSGRKREEVVDLTSLDDKKIDFKKFSKGVNEHQFELPVSKRKITFKLLTQSDDKNIDIELKAMKKFTKESGIDPEVTTRLKHSIISLDGSDDKNEIVKFIDNEFLAVDSLAYRTYLTSITPDVDLTIMGELDNGEVEEVAVPVTARFFWPSSKG